MKKLIAATMALIMMFMLCACKEEAVDDAAVPVSNDGADAASAVPENPAGMNTGGAYGSNASAKVLSSAAYAYAGTSASTLYAAVEYENNGDCPIVISSAKFTASCGGISETHEFTPELSEYIVLLPGERSYLAQWIPESSIEPGAEVTLNAELSAKAHDQRGARIKVDHLFVADNYPSLSTLSGRLTCQTGKRCSTNMIYVGFYDAEDRFIGAWYFSKNALFDGGEQKNFVIDMNGFPIKKLSEKVAGIKGIGFGFDF